MSARLFAQKAFFMTALVLTAFFIQSLSTPTPSYAQTTDEIQQQIADHNKKISDLEAEIAKYQKQLDTLGSQHVTLAGSLKSLDVTRKQLLTKILSLQQQISALTLELKQLGRQINDKQKSCCLSVQFLVVR